VDVRDNAGVSLMTVTGDTLRATDDDRTMACS